MAKTAKIIAQGTEISVILESKDDDYISLTDMARYKDNDPSTVISYWMKNHNTLEYLGAWEMLHNPDFKPLQMEGFRRELGLNAFTMSPKKWIEATGAIGIRSKSGRGGGTYAHKDIAFNFGMWLNPVFQLYVVKEYQQLKETTNNPLLQQWDVKRLLSKTNYTLHTDAIKEYVIPQLSQSQRQKELAYATEADMLNIVLFGCTAKQWETANPELAKRYNIRDMATINQLIVLSNIESLNAELIRQGVEREKRSAILHNVVQHQLPLLNQSNAEQRFSKLQENSKLLK